MSDRSSHSDDRAEAVSEDPSRPNQAVPSLDELRRAIARSSASAFETLFRRLSERVFRYVRGMTGSEATADDVTQDTFARLWSHRERLNGVDNLTAYIFQIARRQVYNLHRDRRVRRDNEAQLRDRELAALPDAPDAEVDTEMLKEMLDAWIHELPERQREAITLSRLEGLSHDAIAEVMDISPHTVNSHIVQAMKHLRSRLREHRPDLLS
jgi:RNA polymerase sigma-70 factor (ECF subfamily)